MIWINYFDGSIILKKEPESFFAKRLNESLDKIGFAAKGKGRQVQLADQFKISHESVRKWLSGKSMPEISKIPELAKFLNVTPEWLLYGNTKIVFSNLQQAMDHPWNIVPLISWDEVIDHSDITKSFKKNPNIRQQVGVYAELSQNSFAVILDDDSMFPRFKSGDILVSDPDYREHNLHIGIYYIRSIGRAVCRQIKITSDKKILVAHNPAYDDIAINPKDKYCGSVRQSIMSIPG